MNAFYTVNNQPYNNVYLAWMNSVETGHPVKFYLNEDQYDKIDWTTESTGSFDNLMAYRASELRNKYEKLVLYYSGGFDSQTIYNVFAKNKIHLDAIIIAASEEFVWFPTSVYEWTKNNHWDPHTEIIMLDARRPNERNPFLKNEDWIFDNERPELIRYYNTVFTTTEDVIYQKYSGHTFKCITGYEKPRLVYRNGQWFARQLAMVLEQGFNRPHIEAFFLDPVLAVKQSHVFKNNVKKYIQQNQLPLYDGDWAEAKYKKTPKDFEQMGLDCGRHHELNHGVSRSQKMLSERLAGISNVNLDGPWQDIEKVSPESKFLAEDLRSGRLEATNFLKGVYNLYNQTTLVNHFKHSNLFRNERQNMLYDLPFTWSKEYNIGS
jgi:hypothetical protein